MFGWFFEERASLCPLGRQGSIIQDQGEFSFLLGSTSHTWAAVAAGSNGSGTRREALLRGCGCMAGRAQGAAMEQEPCSKGPARTEASQTQPHKERNLGKAYFCPPFPAIQRQGSLQWLSLAGTAAESLQSRRLPPPAPPGLGTGVPLPIPGSFSRLYPSSHQELSATSFPSTHAEAPQRPLPRSLDPSTAILCDHSQC